MAPFGMITAEGENEDASTCTADPVLTDCAVLLEGTVVAMIEVASVPTNAPVSAAVVHVHHGGSFAPAKKGGEKFRVTKKGKGTKWMFVVDGNGLPLGLHLDSASTAEVKLAELTLGTVGVSRPRGRPTRRPERLVADRGYDSSAFRCALRRRGIKMRIPAKRHPATWRAKQGRPVVAHKNDYRLKYKVERSFAWLGNFRRLLIRWERAFTLYRGFFCVVVLLAARLLCR